MIKKQTKGALSELCTAVYLVAKGYRIIGKNKRVYGVEFDLLASKQSVLVAVEVKFRKSTSTAHNAIHPKQRERQRKAMNTYVQVHQFSGCRIDAILITPNYPFIEHIKNAY